MKKILIPSYSFNFTLLSHTSSIEHVSYYYYFFNFIKYIKILNNKDMLFMILFFLLKNVGEFIWNDSN